MRNEGDHLDFPRDLRNEGDDPTSQGILEMGVIMRIYWPTTSDMIKSSKDIPAQNLLTAILL